MTRIAIFLLALGLALPGHAAVGRAIARGTARSVARRVSVSGARRQTSLVLRRDALSHLKPARPLARPLTVQRYTSARRAASEVRYGIPVGRHMTSPARRGPPMNAQSAVRRFGLVTSPAPQVRETIHLPKGFPLRSGKVNHGLHNVVERTSSRRVPPRAITSVTRVRSGR